MTETRRGTTMRSRTRILAAATLATILSLTASGCSLLIPPPPDSVSSAVDLAVADLRSTAGVASVTSDVSPYDLKDGGPLSNPDAWLANITVQARPDAANLPVLADAVAHSIDTVHDSVRVDATLHLSVGARGIETTIALPVEGGSAGATPADQLVGTAEQLAAIDSVSSISLGSKYDKTSIGVTALADVSAAAAAVRQLPAFGVGELDAVRVYFSGSDKYHATASVATDAASPSPELLALITRLVEDADVTSIFFDGVQSTDGEPAAADVAGWRPALSVSVDDEKSQAVAVSALESSTEPQSLDATVPRASFKVTRYTEATGSVDVDGFVGLPVGSPAPDDARKPAPQPAPASTPAAPAPETPEEQAARVEADKVAVGQLLDAAGDIAGIRGTSMIQTIACDIGGAPTGQQVTGSVVIPIFEVADTADDAYAAITKSWKAGGFGSADNALGRAYYRATSPTASVQQVSIRGKAEGLSITAEGRC